jgi:hypothetical protein
MWMPAPTSVDPSSASVPLSSSGVLNDIKSLNKLMTALMMSGAE